jgi:Fe2+ transport system protein FeoA
MTLTEIPPGHRARIRHLHGNPDARKRLRELGIYENAVVRCIQNANGIIICGVWQGRVGLTRAVAREILVSTADED